MRIVGLQEQLLKVHLKWLSNLNFILSILPCPRLHVNLSWKTQTPADHEAIRTVSFSSVFFVVVVVVVFFLFRLPCVLLY